jgi:transcriptional regulator with XRE-family HTH domain
VDNLRFRGARQAARIDQQVGERIRKRRTLLGYTQEQLADALEISYQQIQKYETGANRVSAGRLFQIAQRLEAPVTYFFDGLGIDYDGDLPQQSNRITFDLVRNFGQIDEPTVRNALAGLVKALAASGEEASKPDDETGHSDRDEDHGAHGVSHAKMSAGNNANRNGRNGGQGENA